MATPIMLPDPMLADNKKTVEFLIEDARAKGKEAEIPGIKEWGQRRRGRIERLQRFAGLLKRNGVYDGTGAEAKPIEDFVTTQCFAIATKYGLDGMGYRFLDSESGPLSADLGLDLQAVTPEATASPVGIFGTPAEEEGFLAAVRGKDKYELGRMARPIVIEERHRIYENRRRDR